MYFNASWHASGLRWIGNLFEEAAIHLERAAARDEPAPPRDPGPQVWPSDEFIDDVRRRIYLRGLL
jgi:hypothetical protein